MEDDADDNDEEDDRSFVWCLS